MSCRCDGDLGAGVGLTPQKRKTGEPVFCVDRLPDARKFLGGQNLRGCGEFGAGDFSTDGTRGDLHLRVVANALALAQFAVRHEVEFVIIFGKPDRRVDCDTAFAEGGQADITLAVDFCGNGRHADIVNSESPFVDGEN